MEVICSEGQTIFYPDVILVWISCCFRHTDQMYPEILNEGAAHRVPCSSQMGFLSCNKTEILFTVGLSHLCLPGRKVPVVHQIFSHDLKK